MPKDSREAVSAKQNELPALADHIDGGIDAMTAPLSLATNPLAEIKFQNCIQVAVVVLTTDNLRHRSAPFAGKCGEYIP